MPLIPHTEDAVFHLHGGGEPAAGWSATRDAFARALEQWPDIRFDRRCVHIGGGHFVSEYEMSATTGGREINCDGVDVFAVEDGRVARKDAYLDWAAVQQQLGDPARPQPDRIAHGRVSFANTRASDNRFASGNSQRLQVDAALAYAIKSATTATTADEG